VSLLVAIASRVGRTLLLMLLASAGTVFLVRLAPGFFSDAREMDARYARSVQMELAAERGGDQSAIGISLAEAKSWLHGDFGQSREYHVPVVELIGGRLRVTALLLIKGIVSGWLLALWVAFPVSGLRRGGTLWGAPFTILLAMPTAAMATACILSEAGGPVLVLTMVIAAREFKFLRSLLVEAWRAPHLVQGRAQGMRPWALARVHILPNIAPRLSALAALSIVTALGALVPIEAIFSVPGVGQLAWSAVMNRDLPVLAAVSLLMAFVVGLTSLMTAGTPAWEGA